MVAGQVIRSEAPTTKSAAASQPREAMPRDFKANDLLKLPTREDQLLGEGAFADAALEDPGKDFRHHLFDRRIRSGRYRGYRYDDLLTMPDYISYVYASGHKPGMEAIKAYFNFAMKHQLAVTAGKEA